MTLPAIRLERSTKVHVPLEFIQEDAHPSAAELAQLSEGIVYSLLLLVQILNVIQSFSLNVTP